MIQLLLKALNEDISIMLAQVLKKLCAYEHAAPVGPAYNVLRQEKWYQG